ncbi:MAG TPA: DUF4011 domain-containing protein, partial [Pirellulaceae bacterium]|nr:DUF4011 domain-containing protein [Pirellulaceae bacterium]
MNLEQSLEKRLEKRLEEHLRELAAAEPLSIDDVLATFLPLAREVVEAHRAGLVAPLEGLADLRVDEGRIWFESIKRREPRESGDAIVRLEQASLARLDVVEETRRADDGPDGDARWTSSELGTRGEPVVRPVFLPGYVAWEHELGHHDPLTDIHSLGLILASLACGLNLCEPRDLELFVTHRRNLFALRPQLNPVLARAILNTTELDRRRRVQDLPALLHALANYREQQLDFEIDLARTPGFRARDPKTKQDVVLTKLRDRLFDVSRRNSLLHFRATGGSVNLTQASIPLMVNLSAIREDQLLVADERLVRQIVVSDPISLNKYLNFSEAIYLPSLLERIIGDARRDQQEFGCAQLRLVLCFLSWTNLKEQPVERFVSPLVLVPVRLIKSKGIRDTYLLDPLTAEAEINPVLRHQFRQLYNITLPETIDLSTASLDSLYEFIAERVRASEPGVSVEKLSKPRIDLIHDRAQRRVEQYRRTARLSGRGVRSYLNTDYSYDRANFHPLGVQLFSTLVRTPECRLRAFVEDQPRPPSYVVPAEPEPPNSTQDASQDASQDAQQSAPQNAPAPPDSDVIERTFYQVRDSSDDNPYVWNFDLCNVTLANFHYRRMSLVRDYEAIQERALVNEAFDATFSLSPRPVRLELPEAPPLAERFDVVPCDPTQATAIAEARRGASYLIQGPPGTGKSQTITNLIADYVARGLRVLFVCEKRAAIDVVFARLKQTGLGTLGCLIHDSQTDKKEFILDLKQTYETLLAESARDASVRETVVKSLTTSLAPLERFDEAMQAAPESCGIPTRELIERCLRVVERHPSERQPGERDTDSAEPIEGLPDYRDWDGNQPLLDELQATIADIEPSGVWARHPL